MQEIISQMAHMNFETTMTVILIGYSEVILGIAVYKNVEKKLDAMWESNEDYILELLVRVPWLENRIRSYRLRAQDIKAMSRKGYKVFDGNKGRFVKELSR